MRLDWLDGKPMLKASWGGYFDSLLGILVSTYEQSCPDQVVYQLADGVQLVISGRDLLRHSVITASPKWKQPCYLTPLKYFQVLHLTALGDMVS
jgi:hypothetical protein